MAIFLTTLHWYPLVGQLNTHVCLVSPHLCTRIWQFFVIVMKSDNGLWLWLLCRRASLLLFHTGLLWLLVPTWLISLQLYIFLCLSLFLDGKLVLWCLSLWTWACGWFIAVFMWPTMVLLLLRFLAFCLILAALKSTLAWDKHFTRTFLSFIQKIIMFLDGI